MLPWLKNAYKMGLIILIQQSFTNLVRLKKCGVESLRRSDRFVKSWWSQQRFGEDPNIKLTPMELQIENISRKVYKVLWRDYNLIMLILFMHMVQIQRLQCKRFVEDFMRLLKLVYHFTGELVTGMLIRSLMLLKYVRNITYINLLYVKINTAWL